MGKKNKPKELTHEEIWDDSALVRSWDEAVEEYKLYHSIQARGENVEEVLRKAEEAELAGRDIGEVGYEGEPMDTETAKTGAPMAAVEDESAGIAENARQTTQADNEQPEPATSNATPQQEAGNANVSGANIPFAAPEGTASVPNAVLGDGETPYMLEWKE
ncbi:hypothetical protein T310_0348 [Rasamsonia emersonii CBS 393.64]|uniref:Survival Motor Neuron Gemin2-binding domain-containing protein n=1 Tax=Rasamsonia emersonii (strain ATCC 16479 / CBS 393.64 / IMI 116815) TaxID=1408163 RepID=A0A0F4Z527_RASE3|nr:hypothetical protein T310_0348 [Rasamsonia emersonii CBS 393.64]KKA25619.1 hypothetical protein T310_0348 [Rasamsonia emersonii CBS 393.64]